MSRPKYKDKDVVDVTSFNAKWVAWAHTVTACTAFLSALVIGMSLHFHKIVSNEWFSYPDEWFPSVSATIGDRYPERAFFQFFIAITSGPRFALVALWFVLTARPGAALPKFLAVVGVFRTLMCAGFTYVTSTDDHDWHDIFMISYMVATLPWTACCLALSPPNPKAIRYRKLMTSGFFGTIVPLVYYYIQHKVHRVPGAYTTYAFFEWFLVLFDVGFDAVAVLDFKTFEITIHSAKGLREGADGSCAPKVIGEEQHITTNESRAQRSPAAVPNGEEQKTPEADAPGEKVFWVELLDTAADIYHGFVFWSTLTSLGLCIWYFPLWEMGISGFETFIMSTVSPLLLASRSIRLFVVKNLGTCHFMSLIGLCAFLVSDPVWRLSMVGFAVWMACLSWAATLHRESVHPKRLESKILAWASGLVLSSTAKFACKTNNPIWPILNAKNGGLNGIGLALGVLAACRFTRRRPLDSDIVRSTKDGSALLSALGIAGLFFGMHSLLSDTSTMIMWVWTGYPIQGPVAVPHGFFTLGAMTTGLITGIYHTKIASSWLAYVMGCLGAACVTYLSGWSGYGGAIAVAFYLMMITNPLVAAASRKNPGFSFGLGFLLYNLLVLFHVWVVAYAFVPGGPLVREHTDWVMLTMMLLIGAGVFNLEYPGTPPEEYRQTGPARHHRKFQMSALGIINALFLVMTYFRFPTMNYEPYHPDAKLLTAGIWTIHFTLDNHMWSSEHRLRNLIQELEIDVIGLLETDQQRIIMGNRDSTQFFAEELGMWADYGPGPNKHTWGAALLSKFPIVNSTHHLLPSPAGELSPAVHATIDAYGELMDVFVFHSGQAEDVIDRQLQADYMAGLMGSSNRPAILLAYLVTKPGRGNYNTYVSDQSGMHDVDPTDGARWCEYILYKGLLRTGYARVSRSTVTDTELQVAKFVVPTTEEDKALIRRLDNDQKQRDRQIFGLKVTNDWKFPPKFRGQGVRGHFYHVFNYPRYYEPGDTWDDS